MCQAESGHVPREVPAVLEPAVLLPSAPVSLCASSDSKAVDGRYVA